MAFQLGLARACRPTGLGREAVALTALAVVAPGLWPQAVLAAGAGAVEPLHVGPVPVDFVLFALIPLGIASFHHHTFNVAMMGLAAILADKLAVTGFKTGPGIPGLLGHLAHERVTLANLFCLLLGFALLAKHFEDKIHRAFWLCDPVGGCAGRVRRSRGSPAACLCADLQECTADAAAVSKDWDDIISINLTGVFNVTHAFLAQIRGSKGRIVNIGSIQSFVHVSWPNSAAYTTAKRGVLGFTPALAAELGKDGVRVNAIGPGLIETPLNAQARASNPGMVAKVLDHTPLGRAGKPEDIVGPALFLASDLSAYVTGSIIMADGGFRTI